MSSTEKEIPTTAIVRTENVKPRFSLADIERIGTLIAKSNLFGVKTADQAIALCLIADAEGQHPALAASDYHIIQNTPSLKAKTLQARFQAAGGKVEWKESTDERAEATFSHPSGGTITIDWDMARAKQAGLDKKDNWIHYKRAMLRARVISEGVPAILPGASRFYTSEEVTDFDGKGYNQPPTDVTDKVEVLPPATAEPKAKSTIEAPPPAATTAPTDAKAKVEQAKTAATKRKGGKEKTTAATKKTASRKLTPVPPSEPEVSIIDLLKGLDHDNNPTLEDLTKDKRDQILNVFKEHGVEKLVLENWTRLDAPDWTASIKVDLLKLHELVVAGTVKSADIEEYITAREASLSE